MVSGSAPCLTPFKPFMPAAPFEEAGRGGGSYNENHYWWRHEAMYVNALFRSCSYRASITDRIRAMEAKWEGDFNAHTWGSREDSLVNKSHRAFIEADSVDRVLLEQMRGMKRGWPSPERFFWKRTAVRNGIPIL